jgi:histidine triad (HIT) family protein
MIVASLRWRTVSDACLFCSIVAGDLPASVVAGDDAAIAFLDINPLTTGHTLVVPRRHVTDLLDADGAVAEVSPLLESTGRLLVDRLGADGINVFQASRAPAGQTVFHLHFHLLPRWSGDGMLNVHSIRTQVREDRDTTFARLTG